jgi:hypothetical protein
MLFVRRLCFTKLKLLLIAVEGRGDDGAGSSLAINPGPSVVIDSSTQGFFIAESADDVKRSVPARRPAAAAAAEFVLVLTRAQNATVDWFGRLARRH